MKRTVTSLFLLLQLFVSACQFQEVTYHPYVQMAMERSLYTNKIEWPQVNQRFIELTDGKSGDEMKEGLQFLINSLGDKHASIRSAKDHSIIVYYSGPSNADDTRDAHFINTVINDTSSHFSYEYLKEDIGYLKVVGIGPGDVQAQAEAIRKGLLDLKSQGVAKWILDLRFNGGGNVNPMLAGLAPLLGDGLIASAVNAEGEQHGVYKIEGGQFINHGFQSAEMNVDKEISADERVAVLLSRYTVSSGELTAIGFKGRKNTVFIGEETGGFTTGNGYAALDEDYLLVISESIFADRNGVAYKDKVSVDETIEFDHSMDLSNDIQLKRAIEWLSGER